MFGYTYSVPYFGEYYAKRSVFMQRTVRLIILAIALAAVLATCTLAILYVRYGREVPRKTDEGTPALYTLGVWEGQLAVFEGTAAFPQKLYEVPISALPPAEQEKLKAGIAVASAAELQVLLEDYTS